MDLKDPNTLNLYQYVKGNPLKYVDYSGHESIGEPKSYLERTLDMVILGSYTDEFTWLGLGIQLGLGFFNLDFPCDVRDFTADITVNKDTTSPTWWGTIVLDAVALVPVIGIVKYLDDLAYGVKMLFKNGDELIDGSKRIARFADALGDISKKGGTVLNDMADTLRGVSKKAVKNADILNDAKYIDDMANVASDAGKRLDDVAGGGVKTISYTDYENIHQSSIHNPNADKVMLGKYDGGASTSYINQAGDNYTYFSIDNWDAIKEKYDFTDDDMFKLFNEAFLDDCINEGKTFQFSHNPIGDQRSLGQEFQYLLENNYEWNPLTMTMSPKY